MGKKLKPAQLKAAEEANQEVLGNALSSAGRDDGWGDGRQLETGKVLTSEERRAAEREKRLAAIAGRSGGSAALSAAVPPPSPPRKAAAPKGATKWSKTNKISTFSGSGKRLS